MSSADRSYGDAVAWKPARPKLRPVRLVLSLLVAAASIWLVAAILPGVSLGPPGSAFIAAVLVGVINAVLPPLIAALRLPFALVSGFLAVLLADAAALKLASDVASSHIHVDSLGTALVASLLVSVVSLVLQVMLGVNDNDEYNLRVTRRIASRQGAVRPTDEPGILFLEIDGLALPVLRDAMRDGNAPTMARWVAEDGYRLTEWEPDLSSQTGASQAGILLGSNEDIPAFRWVEKESGRMMVCSSPADCAEVERRHARGIGLLRRGGTSRGNLLSGEAEETILTVSRTAAERGANPGYRAYFANGFNVTRALVLFTWEVILELIAAARSARRDIRPRGHRGFTYALLRGALCVVIRDLIVYSVINDLLRGRPAIYATFSSYDEVAHHSGLERSDTLEALRKLDGQFARIAAALRYAPRPYEIVVLSDHGQTQGETFKVRAGYGLDELVDRSLERRSVHSSAGGDEQNAMVGHAFGEATGRKATEGKTVVGDHGAMVLGSGNLGLIYLMELPRRMMLEEIEDRHPALIPALRDHPLIGWLLVHSRDHGAVVLGAHGTHWLDEQRVEGDDPLVNFSPNAPTHLLRTDRFEHVADIMVGSFYDPVLDEGCAFEELISFHGGLGGPQTRPFILSPPSLPLAADPIIGAAAVHHVLSGWRELLQPDDLGPADQQRDQEALRPPLPSGRKQ
jgi:uncharacterized membrane protein YvlD (DUF360 family)